MKSVFHVWRGIGLPPQATEVRLILGEQQFWMAFAIQRQIAELTVRGPDGSFCHPTQQGLDSPLLPRPSVAKPECRKQMKVRPLWPTVVNGDSDQDVFGVCFGVFGKHIEIAVAIKNPGVEEFVLKFFP